MAAVSYFLIKWHLQRRDRDFYIAVALYALSFGNHLLSITLLPAFIFLVVATDKQVFVQPKKVFWVLTFVALGALQYSYLWWRLTDPQTLYIEGLTRQNFFYFVTGGRFKPLIFAFSPGEVLTQRIPLALAIISNNQPILISVAAIGVFVGRMTRPVRIFLLIYFVSNAFYAINYNIPDIGGYFLANDLVVAIFVGVALERLTQWRFVKARPKQQQCWLLGCLCLIPVVYYVARYPVVNRSGDVRQRNATEIVLETVGKDAVLLSTDYQTGQGFLYYLLAEGKGEADNLHTIYFRSSVHRLQDYLDGNKTLGRGVSLGLPLYAYPCPEERVAELGLRALEVSPKTPRLCKLETPDLGEQVNADKKPGIEAILRLITLWFAAVLGIVVVLGFKRLKYNQRGT